MKNLPLSLCNRSVFFLVGASLVLNFFFLFFLYDDSYYRSIATVPGEMAYNVWRYNSTLINPERGAAIDWKQKKENRIVQYYEIDQDAYGPGIQHKGIADTVGYGIIVGLLWKLSNSLSYFDMQVLQIVIFSLLMFLIYGIGLILFNDPLCAFLCALALLLFFPLTFLNVHTMRDIWIYYGLVVLLYGFLYYVYVKASRVLASSVGIFFALCEFIRPPLSVSLLFLTGLALVGALLYPLHKKRIIQFSMYTWFFSLLCFWAPFCYYNHQAYGRYLVGTLGQNLIEGLGEFANPWGLELSDNNFASIMKEKYGMEYGTLECEDQAKKLFLELLKEDPWFYCMTLFRRLHRLILPGLSWFAYLSDKAKFSFNSLHSWADFWGRAAYVRLYLLVGYLGLVLLLFRRRWREVFIISGVISSSWWIILLHIEHRYLTPYYAFFAFLVGYVLSCIWYKNFKGVQRACVE